MSSGTRYYNFREGDRSEYLAVYLLSAFGLVTQVPRQEDIGIDLICNLSEQETGILSFRDHFAVSVKSASTPSIVLEPPDSQKDNPSYVSHYSWLFHFELPLLLGVVDKSAQRLSLYSTLPAWFIHHENSKNCGAIELAPTTKTDTAIPVGRPTNSGPDTAAAGRDRFIVDLGHPISVLTTEELKDKELLRLKKKSLRQAVMLGKASARFAQAGTPFFWWFNQTIRDGYVADKTNPDGLNGGVAWWMGSCANPAELERMMTSLAPSLLSAALLFKSNRPELLHTLREVLRILPPKAVPPEIREKLPEIFSN